MWRPCRPQQWPTGRPGGRSPVPQRLAARPSRPCSPVHLEHTPEMGPRGVSVVSGGFSSGSAGKNGAKGKRKSVAVVAGAAERRAGRPAPRTGRTAARRVAYAPDHRRSALPHSLPARIGVGLGISSSERLARSLPSFRMSFSPPRFMIRNFDNYQFTNLSRRATAPPPPPPRPSLDQLSPSAASAAATLSLGLKQD